MNDAATSGEPTRRRSYTERLESLEGARWKRLLDVQRPYRWNLRRLKLGRVLDVGCGLGRNLVAFEGAVGVDHNQSSVAEARRRGLTAWSTDEWPDCPDAVPGTFDTMLVAHVLEHMDQRTGLAVLGSYLPYLKPEAALVLICPQERGYASDPTHVRWVDDVALVGTAEALGFVPVRSYSFPLPRVLGRAFTYNEFVLVAHRREAQPRDPLSHLNDGEPETGAARS
jgi:SAM-dependent methyltransferase